MQWTALWKGKVEWTHDLCWFRRISGLKNVNMCSEFYSPCKSTKNMIVSRYCVSVRFLRLVYAENHCENFVRGEIFQPDGRKFHENSSLSENSSPHNLPGAAFSFEMRKVDRSFRDSSNKGEFPRDLAKEIEGNFPTLNSFPLISTSRPWILAACMLFIPIFLERTCSLIFLLPMHCEGSYF